MAIADLVYEQTKSSPNTSPGRCCPRACDPGVVGYLTERQERERDRDLIDAQESALKTVGITPRIRRGIVFERGDLVLISFPFSDREINLNSAV